MPNLHETRVPYRSLSEIDWRAPPLGATYESEMIFLSWSTEIGWTIDEADASPPPLVREGVYAPWVLPTLDRLGNLMDLRENWDSYGAATILFENVQYAFRLLEFTMEDDTPSPFIVPTAERSVQVEWHQAGLDLEVEVRSPYRVHASYEDHAHPETNWEKELTIDLTLFKKSLGELTRRARTGLR